MDFEQYKYLKNINSPQDLKSLDLIRLEELCAELRGFVVEMVSKEGGHLGASLGVTELSVALHHVFNSPKDNIIWDVGHQAYIHKILTGRKEKFDTNRKKGGISGFPHISESEHDKFTVGHSSTSISAGLGRSVAAEYLKDTKKTVVVIGDGALTGGMAFEALNNAGYLKKDLLVILNDNNMSIDPNVGALKQYLTRITSSKSFNRVRDEIWDMFSKMNKIGDFAKEFSHKVEAATKTFISKQSNFFESLGFKYYGPADGHNLKDLISILQDLKVKSGPVLLHIKTKKGKGYSMSENGDETHWHAPGTFNPQTGRPESRKTVIEPPKYQDVFGETIIELAEKNKNICAVTPAMPTGSSLKKMLKIFPERTFDVGISEQHAVTFSAGMALEKMRPFCAIYSTFLQRGYDQLIHDVALQNLPVVFCVDRAGLVGEDGATHQGAFDLAYMNCIPNMIVSAPINEHQLRNLLYTSQLESTRSPFSIRYPRGKGVLMDWKNSMKELKIGKGEVIKPKGKIVILSLGTIGNEVKEAIEKIEAEGTPVAHYNMIFLKPIDTSLLKKALEFDGIITVEEGVIRGGFGSEVNRFLLENGYTGRVKNLGVDDRFIEHASQQQQKSQCHIDTKNIVREIRKMVETL